MTDFKIVSSNPGKPYEPSSPREAAALKFDGDLLPGTSARVREIFLSGRTLEDQDFEKFWLDFCEEHPISEFGTVESVDAQIKPMARKYWDSYVQLYKNMRRT